MERILISLPSSFVRILEEEAARRGLSRTAFIRLVLIEAMEGK